MKKKKRRKIKKKKKNLQKQPSFVLSSIQLALKEFLNQTHLRICFQSFCVVFTTLILLSWYRIVNDWQVKKSSKWNVFRFFLETKPSVASKVCLFLSQSNSKYLLERAQFYAVGKISFLYSSILLRHSRKENQNFLRY